MSKVMLDGAFPELESLAVPPQTILYGPLTDEAHLYGLLARFQSLGLRVVELRQLPERPAESESESGWGSGSQA